MTPLGLPLPPSRRFILRGLAGGAACLGATGCFSGDQTPVIMGFIGTIKAYSGDHDRAGRDGAILAVETINAAGGIGGRRIELRVIDDEFSPERAAEAVRTLARAGAALIVGPMTSRMAEAAARAADEEGIVLIAPASSTTALAGKDDHFFRVYPQTHVQAHALAARFAALRVSLIHIVKDDTNLAHTADFERAFFDRFTELGGTRGTTVDFDPATESSLSDVVQRLPIASDEIEAIILLSTPPNVALFAQILRRRLDNRSLGASEWAASSALIALGGSAVEGLRIAKVYNDGARDESTAAFRGAFLSRFYYEPSFPAAGAHEAVTAAAEALPKAASREDLRRALIESGPYKGIQGFFSFDASGDVKRPINVLIVRDGTFVVDAAESAGE